MALNTPDAIYTEQSQLWQEVRAALAGKYAVIDIVTCLPAPQYKLYPSYTGMTTEQQQQANQCNTANTLRVQSYWARGRFFNATSRTKESLDGMIWSKQPEEDLANSVSYMEQSADGSGSGLREVAQKITSELVSIGRYGVLVDMPDNESGLTQAQMQEPDKAPRMIQYKAEQIIFVKCNGLANAVDEIRLIEFVEQRKEGSDYDWETVQRIRRLVMIEGAYHNQLLTEKGEVITDVVPVSNGSVMSEMPFQFFGADNNSPEYSKVPLYDLANANLGHFVLDCDNRDNLHFHGQGMTNTFVQNPEDVNRENPGGIDVGAKGINTFGENDRVEILQLEATGAIPAEMLRDEQRMVMQGAQLVTESSSNQTLGAKEIDVGTSTSTLKRIAYNASTGIEQCLLWAAEFLGSSDESVYQLNTDFVTDSLTPEMIAQHIAIVQTGLLPRSPLYETARSAGFTKKSDEELMEEAEADNLSLPGMTEEQAIIQAASE